MRIILPCLTLVFLAACQPPIPDSRSSGVGFESYGEYQRRRVAEQQARGPQPATVQTVQGPVQNPALPFPPPSTPITGAPTAAELAAAGVRGAAQIAPAPVPQPLPQTAQASAPAQAATTAPVSNAGISDEQDFQAVSSRESIESDRERIAQNRAQYQQIQPTELPQRTRTIAPEIIQYAINAPNRLGQPIYKRSGLTLSNFDRSCARYATPEAAQAAFLRSGGPKRDPKNLDPDGDGFACYWDPTPYQTVRN
ncbi:hypothetical protein DEA8626_00828 [Defluviimonas aquaemixtae]|uniref:Excalibur calcium-binding domain-containing protein n=1 Tax=Albidovulum aquaemixtae TaxID=1542388 RepID=A0A2R8B457_9RHOB|nr:hypothetical protein [Defluviimonas aquaemixtae]SPH17310.1 hypothetical protein DEA8626_00828 [Defluviimonas aquaemixtae]